MRIGTADAEAAAAAAAAAAVSNNQLRYLITATTAARADKERSAIASTKQSFSFFLATFHPFFFIFSQTLYSRPKLLHFLALVVATATASASLSSSSSSSLLSSPAAVAARIFTTCRTLCKIRGMVSFLGKRSQKSKTFFLRHRPTTMTTTTTTTTTATTTTMEAWLNHQQMILYRR